MKRSAWCLSSSSVVVIMAFGAAGCSDEPLSSPLMSAEESRSRSSAHAHHATPALEALVTTGFRFLDTPLGEQPQITPSLRIESPTSTGRVRAHTPVTIRVAYHDFDNQPQLRTAPAGSTLGSQPQVLVQGRVQGHIHGYLQPLPEDGTMPAVDAMSFCVLERVQRTGEFSGIAEGECPAVPAGAYRLSAEFQTNSHTAILKSGPRATPTADVLLVRVL